MQVSPRATVFMVSLLLQIAKDGSTFSDNALMEMHTPYRMVVEAVSRQEYMQSDRRSAGAKNHSYASANRLSAVFSSIVVIKLEIKESNLFHSGFQ